MYCYECGSELVWRKQRNDGFNIKTGNPQVFEINTCPLAETLPWYIRMLTSHRMHPLVHAYGDFAYEDTRVIDVIEKEKA